MELSELYKGFIDLIGDSDLIHAVYDILMCGKKMRFLHSISKW